MMHVNCLEMSFQNLQIPRWSLSRVVSTLLGRRLQWNAIQSQHHFVFIHALHSLSSTTDIHLSLLAPLLFSTIAIRVLEDVANWTGADILPEGGIPYLEHGKDI